MLALANPAVSAGKHHCPDFKGIETASRPDGFLEEKKHHCPDFKGIETVCRHESFRRGRQKHHCPDFKGIETPLL